MILKLFLKRYYKNKKYLYLYQYNWFYRSLYYLLSNILHINSKKSIYKINKFKSDLNISLIKWVLIYS